MFFGPKQKKHLNVFWGQTKHLKVGSPPNKDIQIEVDTKEQLDIALTTKASSILLDNFDPKTLPKTIQKIRENKKGKEIYIELSGGITQDNIEEHAKTAKYYHANE